MANYNIVKSIRYTLCFKKRAPFLFLRLPILKIFSNIAAKEICNKIHISNFVLMRSI